MTKPTYSLPIAGAAPNQTASRAQHEQAVQNVIDSLWASLNPSDAQAAQLSAQQAAASADTASAAATTSTAAAAQAELAALAAGAPIVTSLTSPVPANGTVELLRLDAGLQVHEVESGSWELRGWLVGPTFDTVALMLDSPATTFGPEGQIIEGGGFRYKVVDDDEHRETAGGVKLRCEPDTAGFSAAAFGAHGQETDDTDALKKALVASRGHELFIPPGTYFIEDTLTLHDTNRLRLSPNTIIRAGQPIAGAMLDLPQTNTSGVREQFGIFGGLINGNNLAQTGVSIVNASWRNQIVAQALRIQNCLGDGLNMFRCQGPVIQAIFSRSNGGTGINLRGCNGLVANGVSGYQNGLDGIRIASEIGLSGGGSPVTFSGAVLMTGFVAEQNERHGVFLDGSDGNSTPSTLIGGWIEQNDEDGIHAEESRATIMGCRISGFGNGTNRGINLVSGGSYYVYGNAIGISGGNANYQQTSNFGVEDNSTRSVVGPNMTGSFVTFQTIRDAVLGANLTQNGDFETGDTTGWGKDGSTTIEAQTDVVASGTYSLRVVYAFSGSDIRQTHTTVAGTLYRARFKYRTQTGDTSPPNLVFRTIDSGETRTSAAISLSTKDTWQEAELHFIARSASVDVRILSSGGAGTVYLDDIEVVPVYRPRAVATRMYDRVAEFAQPAPVVLT